MFKKFLKKSSLTMSVEERLKHYFKYGRVPWDIGYFDFREREINRVINNLSLFSFFAHKDIPEHFGIGLDERCIEYPLVIAELKNSGKGKILDAGSTFNYDFALKALDLSEIDLSILTFFPEENCFWDKRISYVFADLRDIPFKDNLFDFVFSQSTIEHVGMNNQIYGYKEGVTGGVSGKNYDYKVVLEELFRVTKPKGKLLLTFPFGRFENHGFFQQFDDEMLSHIEEYLSPLGLLELYFYKYETTGWRKATRFELSDVVSYNPHTGVGKGTDGAAHCRSICFVKFTKA